MPPASSPPGYLDLFKDPVPSYTDGNLTIVRYDTINFQQFLDLKDKEKAIVCIPISPLEIHGKYLPLSADYLESFLGFDLLKEALKKERAGQHYTLVEMPGIPVGTGTNRGHWGTIHTSRKTFHDLCVQLFDSLVYAGFRKIFVMSVHHGMIHSYAIEEAAARIMKRYKKLGVKIASPNHWIARTLFIDDPVGVFTKYVEKHGQAPLTEGEIEAINADHHAGMMEIVFTKKISEKLVDPSYKTAPRNVEHMDAQLKGLLIRKWAAHPPCEPDGCGYNADPSYTDKRDWYALFSDVISDVGLRYIDALVSDDPAAFEPYANMNPWRQKNKKLEVMRRLFLGANSTRNLVGLVVAVAIALPWILYIGKLLGW